MILLLIILFFVSATVASITFLLNRRKALQPPPPQETFNPPPTYRSLFAPDEEELKVWQREQEEKEFSNRQSELRENLLRRAENSDYNSLLEAKVFGNSPLYNEVFQILLRNDSDALIEFVTRNNLTADSDLVELSGANLSKNPTLDNLHKYVHLATLTNSAEIFLQVLETTNELYKQKRLNEISGEKLIEVLESHYWSLTGAVRVSGAGYLLKEKMANIRREILEK